MRERAFVAIAMIFLLLWVISELEERVDRRTWHDRLDSFMEAKGPNSGNRFTAEDGQKLRDRIEQVAKECEQQREDCSSE